MRKSFLIIKKGAVKDELKKLEIDPDKVRAVLLTHSDGDHAGGISLFDKESSTFQRRRSR